MIPKTATHISQRNDWYSLWYCHKNPNPPAIPKPNRGSTIPNEWIKIKENAEK